MPSLAAAPGVVDGTHLRGDVEQEQHRGVTDAGQARGEASLSAALVLGRHLGGDGLPVGAERRVRQHVVELLVLEPVDHEGVALTHVRRVLPFDQQVRLADRVGSRVDLLPEQRRGSARVQAVQVLVGHRQHAARADRGVVDRADLATVTQCLGVLGVDEVHQEPYDVAGCVELACAVVRGLREPVDQVLEQVPHVRVGHVLGTEVDALEVPHHRWETITGVERAQHVLEVEGLEHVKVRGEARDVVDEVRRQILRVLQRPFQRVIARGPEA